MKSYVNPCCALGRLSGRVNCLLSGAIFLLASAASGTTYLVRPDGSGDFPNIQAAVNAAARGDVIELADGVFAGPGNRAIDFSGKAITVRSRSGSPRDCVIDATGGDDYPGGFYFVMEEGPDSEVEGILITNGHSYLFGGAIYCDEGSSPTLRRCIFSHNFAMEGGGGVACMHWSNPNIVECVFEENSTAGVYGAGGLWAHLSSPIVTDCTFTRNTADCAPGAMVWFSSAVFTNCTFYANQSRACVRGDALMIQESALVILRSTIVAFHEHPEPIWCALSGPAGRGVELDCCDLFGNGDGDWVGCVADQYGERGNICADPLFCDPEDGDLHLDYNSPCAPPSPDPQCGLIGAWPIGCGAPTVVRELSWGRIKKLYHE